MSEVTHLVTIVSSLFLFTDPAPSEIYTLSLHDALPISDDRDRDAVSEWVAHDVAPVCCVPCMASRRRQMPVGDRKSTRLNSSHITISYAVFCLKKKKHKQLQPRDLSLRPYLRTTTCRRP